ncbi:hypothetical protein EV126DRAFT_45822 [Verticillium dahliae]|nr:hypothetical protein EV126DRAFT_45822 [Verticillium dahliae]
MKPQQAPCDSLSGDGIECLSIAKNIYSQEDHRRRFRICSDFVTILANTSFVALRTFIQLFALNLFNLRYWPPGCICPAPPTKTAVKEFGGDTVLLAQLATAMSPLTRKAKAKAKATTLPEARS